MSRADRRREKHSRRKMYRRAEDGTQEEQELDAQVVTFVDQLVEESHRKLNPTTKKVQVNHEFMGLLSWTLMRHAVTGLVYSSGAQEAITVLLKLADTLAREELVEKSYEHIDDCPANLENDPSLS